MPKKIIFFILLSFISQIISRGQENKVEFLPGQNFFPSLLFDTKESRTYLSLTHPFPEDILEYNTYVPFALGFKKGLFRWKTNQITGDIGAHTQFGWRKENNKYKQGVRRNHLNTDYILGLSIDKKIYDNLFVRMRVFHQSSHLGDDYVLYYSVPRSGYWANDLANYEQIDITILYKFNFVSAYTGIGRVVTPLTARKRMVFQLGSYISDLSFTGLRSLVFGFDIKSLQQNNYKPMLKCGAGIKLNYNNPIYLIFEYYSGNLPYSRYDSEITVSWFGVSVYFESFL